MNQPADLRHIFLEAVEQACFEHVILGIKEIREHDMVQKNWIARKDIVLKDGRCVVIRLVRVSSNVFHALVTKFKTVGEADDAYRN